MKPKTILAVSVAYLALGMFSVLAFVFLSSLLDRRDYLGRFLFASLVALLIWLSVKIIQGKRFAWFAGAIVFAPLALSGALAIPMYVVQTFGHVDPKEALSPWGCLFCVACVFAYVMLFAHRGVRGLFRRPQVGGETEMPNEGTGTPESKTR